MRKKKPQQARLLDEIAPASQGRDEVELSKQNFIRTLEDIDRLDNGPSLKKAIQEVRDTVLETRSDELGFFGTDTDGDTVSLKKDVLVSELQQIIEAHTIERSKYYIKRLIKGIEKAKTTGINDINLSRWKEYGDIITDSLWLFDRRDNSGVHLASYWGNFVPQIPYQMITRYTKRGEWVLDTFLGSGTTLIECRRLGRNGIGVELNPEVAHGAQKLIEEEQNVDEVVSEVFVGDSRFVDYRALLRKYDKDKVQLLIMHPPYFDIIKFSEDAGDLSNAANVEQFLHMFSEIVEHATPFLEGGRYLVLVIGDKYAAGEWIPLGFYCMNEVLKQGYMLKSIIVKNFEETKGKRNQKELWRYRALVGGFYVFKHEYVMLFKKL